MNNKPLYLKQILNFIKRCPSVINKTEIINLIDAEDKILAENIYSKIDLPPFKNSAVDGYALLKQDLNKIPKKINQYRVTAGDNAKHKINVKFFIFSYPPLVLFVILLVLLTIHYKSHPLYTSISPKVVRVFLFSSPSAYHSEQLV